MRWLLLISENHMWCLSMKFTISLLSTFKCTYTLKNVCLAEWYHCPITSETIERRQIQVHQIRNP